MRSKSLRHPTFAPLSNLKALAGQTFWYGLSNIGGRLITYLLTPFLTHILTGPVGQLEYGRYSLIYLYLPLLNVLYSYGMETAFFRYAKAENRDTLYNTQGTSLLLSTLLFSLALIVATGPVSSLLHLEAHPEYVGWCAAIIALDALCILPNALLREQNRPKRYAFTRIAGIVVFAGFIVAAFTWGGALAARMPGSWFADFYKKHWGVGFILMGNILQNLATLVLLFPQLRKWRPTLDKALLRKVLIYGGPILVTGFAGVMNDTLNRAMFDWLHPGSKAENLREQGIFGAAIRLAIMIQLAIQAFKMSAEPFFFSLAAKGNPQPTYARVMKWFVIVLAAMFLSVALFLDIWKHFVGPEYRDALGLVPVMLMSYVFLGIYYNLAVWYKLTDKTRYGAYIMLLGAGITVAINLAFIPRYGYAACAWSMLVSYAAMMLLSYWLGQRHYPIPYPVRRIGLYLAAVVVLYAAQWSVMQATASVPVRMASGIVLLGVFGALVFRQERSELKSLPVVGKYLR